MGNKFVPIGIIIIALVAILGVKPLIVSIRKVNAQVSAFSERADSLSTNIAKLKEIQPSLVQYSTTIDDLRMAMPAAQQIPEVLVMVEAIAKNTGLNISGFDIQPSSGKSGEVGVNMSASGSYDNLAGFTTKLENNVRPIKINSISVTSAGNASVISVAVNFGILYQGKVDQQVADQIN